MKRLGMMAELHSRPLIQGVLMHKVHGERAWDMPPFSACRTPASIGGLGSDATAVTPSNPFYTLSLAVTGEMIGSRKVNRQSITREQALIAHTHNNAAFLLEEDNIGSLAPGKYADLLILDRNYLTVSVGETKDIKPVLTMVGGAWCARRRSSSGPRRSSHASREQVLQHVLAEVVAAGAAKAAVQDEAGRLRDAGEDQRDDVCPPLSFSPASKRTENLWLLLSHQLRHGELEGLRLATHAKSQFVALGTARLLLLGLRIS